MKKQVSYYDSVEHPSPSRAISVSQAYEAIRTRFKSETQQILKTHSEGIADRFKTISKQSYRDDKTRLLPAVCFTGNIDRSTNKKFAHTGLINLDVDENPADELEDFFKTVSAGKIAIVEAAARSVSGALNGALWVNVRIEIPGRVTHISQKLRRLAGIEGKDHYACLSSLHKAYHKALSHLFKTQTGITIGQSKDLKRLRYLSNDPDIYVNPSAEVYTLKALEIALEEINRMSRRDKEIGGFERLAAGIDTADAFEFAHKFSQLKGYALADGGKHNYLTHFSIALNLLGIDKESTEEYVLNKLCIDVKSNCVEYPYTKYKDSFGVWSHRLAHGPTPAAYSFTLRAQKKLSSVAADITSIYRKESADGRQALIDLKAPTGAGKNYATINNLGPALKELNGCKTVIVCSLNSKVEKDAQQYGIPGLTGQMLRDAPHRGDAWKDAVSRDVILCNQHIFPKVARHFEDRNEQLNVFIDESHTLVDGMEYKPEAAQRAFLAAKRVGRTVTLMSATPKPYFASLGFKRVEVLQDARSRTILKARKRQKNKGLTAFAHCEETDFSKKRLVIKIQSKSTIREVRDLLVKRGIAKRNEIVVLYSEKSVKESSAYKRFVDAGSNEESFAEQVKIILCTSFINEGLDIYSQHDLEFVVIEKDRYVNVDEHIQFLNRHRTDKEKTAVIYFHDPEDVKDPGNFNEASAFEEEVKAYRVAAKKLNQMPEIARQFFAKKSLFRFSSNEFIFFDKDEQAYKVNELAIMGAIEKRKKKHTLVDRALKEFSEKCPCIEAVDERTRQMMESIGAQADAQEVRAKDEAGKASAKDSLMSLYDFDRETLFQAVAIRTDDVRLKKKIDCTETRKDAAEELILKYPDVFGDYFAEAENLIKRYFKLEHFLLEPDEIRDALFSKDELTGERTITSRQKLAVFVAGLRLHLMLFFANYTESEWKFARKPVQALTGAEWQHVRTIQSAIESIGSEANANSGKLTPLQIFRAVDSCYPRRMAKPFDTQNKAVHLANTFFETDRKTGREALYVIKRRRDLVAFLEASRIDPKKYVGKLHKVLKANTLNRQTLKTISLKKENKVCLAEIDTA